MFRSLLIACLVLAALPAAVAAHGGGSPDNCTTDIYGGTTGSLIVPEGKRCGLHGVTVKGSVTVQEDATLATDKTTIKKHVHSDKAAAVIIVDTDVYGQIHISRTSGLVTIRDSERCKNDPYAGGNVHLFKNHGVVHVCMISIRGNLLVQNNDGPLVYIRGNTVGGVFNLIGNDNAKIYIPGNDIGGNLNVEHNTASEWFLINDNHIVKSLLCNGNVPAPVLVNNDVDGHSVGQC